MTTTETLLTILGVCSVFGTIGAVIAEHRGVPPWAGAALGFLLGPVGTLLVSTLPTNFEGQGGREDRLRWEAEQQRIWRENAR